MLQFRIQSTPNPLARKYIINQSLKESGKVSHQTPSQCEHVPMAHALITGPSISQVHFFDNYITITQDGSANWPEIDGFVQSTIAQYLEKHDARFVDFIDVEEVDKPELTPELAEIDRILERTIRPGLQMDGGDIEPIDLDRNILTVRYLGACGGCPSAMTATLEAVTQILRDEYNENLEIVAI